MMNGSPEAAYIRKTTLKEAPLTAPEEAVYNWYVINASERQSREDSQNLTDMDAFADVIDTSYIQKDKKLVLDQRQKEGAAYKTQRAELFEKILEMEANINKWFGENCHLIKTLEFDDRTAGVDLVAEWKLKNGNFLRLGIDCTVSEEKSVLEKKASSIDSELKNEIVTKIKYFNSPKSKKGPVFLLPRVVLALKKETLAELCANIADSKKNQNPEIMGKHFLQDAFLLEILKQLDIQKDFIEGVIEKGKKTRFYVELNRTLELLIEEILTELENKESSLDHDMIQRATDEVGKSSFPSLFSEKMAS